MASPFGRELRQSSGCSFLIDILFGEAGKLLVRRLFFIKRFVEYRYHIVHAKLTGPADERAIACDLVVLDCLGG